MTLLLWQGLFQNYRQKHLKYYKQVMPLVFYLRKPTTAVAGAGTGLGQALLIRDEATKWAVLPTEGGHQPYSPIDKLEIEIHKLLQEKIKICIF
jgi:hypothetical protein